MKIIDIQKAQDIMKREGMDVLIALSFENVKYTAGCHLIVTDLLPDHITISALFQNGHQILVVYEAEKELAKELSWIEDVRTYKRFTERPIGVLAKILREEGYDKAKVGIENESVSIKDYDILTSELPNADFVKADHIFHELRKIKSETEIALLKQAALSTAKAVSVTFKKENSFKTEADVAGYITYQVMKEGGEPLVFNFGSGSNSSMGHRHASLKELAPGEWIHADAKGCYSGYWADVTRMALVEDSSQEYRSIYSKLVNILYSNLFQI